VAYADLDAIQKESLENLLNVIRPKAGEAMQLVQKLRLLSKGTGRQFLQQVLQAIDAGEYIPKGTSTVLEGMTDLTKADVQALLDLCDAMSAAMTSEREAACVNAAGPRMCMGQGAW
jgi:hypothetical protein